MDLPLKASGGYQLITKWLEQNGRQPFLFQEQTWNHIINGESGLVNAPTGCGKTYSVFLGAIIDFINQHPENYKVRKNNGLRLLWITPLRALAKDIGRAMEEVIAELGMQWKVGIRNGDTDLAERARQKKQMPEVLIITPESLHLLLAQKGYSDLFLPLRIIAVDEWHELLGSKRGVQVELAISRLVSICNRRSAIDKNEQLSNLSSDEALPVTNCQLSIWGISATIGNLDEAKQVLMFPLKKKRGDRKSKYG